MTGGFQKIVNFIDKAKPVGSAEDGFFGYEILNEDGLSMSGIDLKLNTRSKVWKITRM